MAVVPFTPLRAPVKLLAVVSMEHKSVSGLEKSVLHLFEHLAYGGVMDPQMRGDLLHGVPKS